MKKKGWVKITPLRWNNINPTLNSLISHKLSSTPHERRFVEIEISVEIKLSYLRGLSEYQRALIRQIEGLRGQYWTFKEIADFLHSKGYTSSRGKPISPALVERMYKKYLKKTDSESLKDLSIRIIDS